MNNWQEFTEKIGKNRLKPNSLARLYLEIENIDELIKAVAQARRLKIPIFIIGTVSSLHLKEPLNGLLIKNNCRRFDLLALKGKIKEQKLGIDSAAVYAESGTNINQLVRFTIEEGMGGLEHYLGWGGTVGGGIYTNKIKHVVDKIKILNKKGEILEVPGDYFNKVPNNNFAEANAIILSAVFRMRPEDKKLLWQRANKTSKYCK